MCSRHALAVVWAHAGSKFSYKRSLSLWRIISRSREFETLSLQLQIRQRRLRRLSNRRRPCAFMRKHPLAGAMVCPCLISRISCK